MGRRFFTAAAVSAAAVTALALLPGTAQAAPEIQITEVQQGVRNPNPVEQCRADGGTCTISGGRSVSHTISSEVGISFGALNAKLGGAYQETYTITNGCTSPTLRKGDVWVMYPRGDFVFFTANGRKGTAFLPTGVTCIIRSDW